jgi:hypothetical protein
MFTKVTVSALLLFECITEHYDAKNLQKLLIMLSLSFNV